MKKTFNFAVTLSVFGHLLGIFLFQPAFNDKNINIFNVYFLGSLFSAQEISSFKNTPVVISNPIYLNSRLFAPYRSSYENAFWALVPERSNFDFRFSSLSKEVYPFIPFSLEKEPSSFMFYPYLPYSFLLYFKDRQKVNLEFLFYLSAGLRQNFLKRKVSSGNLEVDLLVLRHLQESLWLIKEYFPADSYQSIKIELRR